MFTLPFGMPIELAAGLLIFLLMILMLIRYVQLHHRHYDPREDDEMF